jgi:hypothetical protein
VVFSAPRLTLFGTFALLYMTALFLELAEKWTYPGFTLAIFLLIVAIVAIGITRVTFLIFLAVTTTHFLLVQVPDVANHVNIAIYANVVMLVGILYSLLRRRELSAVARRAKADDDCFAMLRPLLQSTAILMYFLAGFHKLNTDFANPTVSCITSMTEDLARMVRSRLLGVPTALILAMGILPVVYLLHSSGWIRRHRGIAAGVLTIGLILLAAPFVARAEPGLFAPVRIPVILSMAALVVAWELAGGPLLAVPRFQGPVLAFSWAMHSMLALILFVDFASLALAILFTFVPRPYIELLNGRVRVPIAGFELQRAHLYFAICVLAGVITGPHGLARYIDVRLVAGIVFNAAALAFIWPLLSALASHPRPAWVGVSLASRVTPKWMFILPVFLLVHGMTSYLGLRTAGNFSMFSNLRTEGARSNHFLLGSNPLKIWDYQEDAVRFISIDDRRAAIGYQYRALKGHQLPVVEFRKLIHLWTKAGRTVPMTFEYQGCIHATDNIVNEQAWRTDARDWEMTLMDFRIIQPEGPNKCRW